MGTAARRCGSSSGPADMLTGGSTFGRDTHARERQADFLAAQVVEIADTVRQGKKVRVNAKGGLTEEHGDMVDRRLMVDARKWLGARDCRIHQAKGLKRARLPNIRSERIIATPKCNWWLKRDAGQPGCVPMGL